MFIAFLRRISHMQRNVFEGRRAAQKLSKVIDLCNYVIHFRSRDRRNCPGMFVVTKCFTIFPDLIMQSHNAKIRNRFAVTCNINCYFQIVAGR